MFTNHFSRLASAILVLVGILICAGWQFRIDFLKGGVFSTFTSPNAALLFILVGLSCLLQLRANSALMLGLGRLAASIVVVFAGAVIVEYLFRVDLGIDTIFLEHRMSDWASQLPPGRPSLPAAFAFLFAGVSAISSRTTRAGLLSDCCATLVAVISYLTLIGYVYQLSTFYNSAMEPTAFLFALVAATLYGMRAEVGIVKLALTSEAGGVIFRRVVSAIVVLMPLLGLLEIRAQHNFFISSQLGTALLVVTAVFVFTAIAAHTGTMLNLLDFKRRQAEEQLLRTEKLAAAGRLSATIAHEVNNPLAAVMNLLYLVKTADCFQTRLEYVRSAEAELRRACAMITRALGFYKDETKPQELNLQELVSEILENEFLQKLLNANVQVNRHFHSAGRVYVRAGEIRQIGEIARSSRSQRCHMKSKSGSTGSVWLQRRRGTSRG